MGKYRFLLFLVEVLLAIPAPVNELGLRLCLGLNELGWPASLLNNCSQSPKEEVPGDLPGGNGHHSNLTLKTPKSDQELFGYSIVCERMNSCQAMLSSLAQMFAAQCSEMFPVTLGFDCVIQTQLEGVILFQGGPYARDVFYDLYVM